jgi:hypothetical protein
MKKQKLTNKTYSELIKLLENTDLPKIELKGYKLRLKSVLLDSKNFRPKKAFFWSKKLVPVGAFLSLVVAFGILVVNPKLMEAKAINIAQKDPQVQELMQESGAAIKEAKVKGNRAYVLLTLPEEKLMPQTAETSVFGSASKIITGDANELQFFAGSVVEISLKEKRVTHVQKLTEIDVPISILSKEEEARAIEIIKQEPAVSKMIPKVPEVEAEIETEKKEVETESEDTVPFPSSFIVKPLPPLKLHLEEVNDEVKAWSEPGEDKRAGVIIQVEDKQRMIMVNITQEKVEETIEEE